MLVNGSANITKLMGHHVSGHFLKLETSVAVWTVGVQKSQSRHGLLAKLQLIYRDIHTRWCPPVISWFIIPLTIDISPTKTIVIGVMFTNLAIVAGGTTL